MSVSVIAEVVEEAVERDRDDEERGHDGGDRREQPGPRRADVDPGEERDAEERRHVEHVSLLDARGELRREHGHHRDDADGREHRRREERLQPRVERASTPDEHDRRGERDHEDVQRELGDVPPEVAQRIASRHSSDRRPVNRRRADPAACVRGRGHATRTATASPADEPVQPAKSRDRRAQAARLEECEQERREQDRAVRARPPAPGSRYARPTSARRRITQSASGSFEHDDEHEHDEQEQRVEGVLRHDRPRVRERRDRNREQRCEESQTVAHDASREEERWHRGERHEDASYALHRRIRLRQAVEKRVGGADQERVDEAVAGVGLIAKQRLAGVGDTARELGPDDLVDEDERGDDPANEDRASERGAGDDRGEPRPGRTRRRALPKVDLGEAPGDLVRLGRLRRDPDVRRGLTHIAEHRVVDRRAAGDSLERTDVQIRDAARRRARAGRAPPRSRPSPRDVGAGREQLERCSERRDLVVVGGTLSATSSGSSENQPTSLTTSGLPSDSALTTLPDVSPIVGWRRFTRTSLPAMSDQRRRLVHPPSRTTPSSSRPRRCSLRSRSKPGRGRADQEQPRVRLRRAERARSHGGARDPLARVDDAEAADRRRLVRRVRLDGRNGPSRMRARPDRPLVPGGAGMVAHEREWTMSPVAWSRTNVRAGSRQVAPPTAAAPACRSRRTRAAVRRPRARAP